MVSWCLCWTVLTAHAQSTTETPTAPETEVLQLTDADAIAGHLRLEYGVAKAVYLTRVAQQLSQSFASAEQLQEQWLQALETDIEEPTSFTHINTHALMAQALIQYTNGMTLNRWRQVDLPAPEPLLSLDAPVNPTTFHAWLALNATWQQLLHGEKQQQVAQWLPWLPGDEPAADETPTAVQTAHSEEADSDPTFSLILQALESSPALTVDSLNDWLSQPLNLDPLSVALLRQAWHREQQQWLALAYDWIELYQLIELSPVLLTAEEQRQMGALISQTEVDWLANKTQVDGLDTQLHEIIATLLTELPNKFKNPDHFNLTLNQQLFSLLTGIKNPGVYFGHPLRADLQQNLEVCLNVSVKQNPEPPVPIGANQYDSCFEDFLRWGTDWASSGNLSGNLIRLDNSNSINRALELPSVQVINNLAMQAAAEVGCQQQLSAKYNAVEWALAAETMAWFHDRWPGLMAAADSHIDINALLVTGLNLHRYPDCVEQAQPLAAQFSLLQTKWERLKQEIISHVKQYTETELKPGNDVDLFQSIEQKSKYIPENFVIGPCAVTQACGAYVVLEPSNELLNLFPNHLKLAEQFGLGSLEICYDQVEWQQRKTTPTHLENNKIANFEGQLYLQLNGRFNDQTVFTKPLLSEQRHVYLFGENNQETLDMACPISLIGKQINTTLDRGTFGLFPNRLTFLTAQKVDINAVIRSNWSDWQTQLSQDPEGFSYFDEMNGMKATLNDALLGHVNDLQQQIYRKLITNNFSRTNDSALSKAAFDFLTHRKLLTHMATGLYPQRYASSTTLRQALSGQQRLVDMNFFRQAYQQQTNVITMMQQGDASFATHQDSWQAGGSLDLWAHSTLLQLQQVLQFSNQLPH